MKPNVSKVIKLRYKNSPIEITAKAALKPEDLYGARTKTVEKDNTLLERVWLTPSGTVYSANDFCLDRLDNEGSLSQPATPCDPYDLSPLPILPSSYKTTRLLEDASPNDLLNFKVRTVLPVKTTLPEGLYKTHYNYRDSPILEVAILNVTKTEAFLLVGGHTLPSFTKNSLTSCNTSI